MPLSSYRDHDFDFGRQILALRSAIDLTQAGLAELLGVSRQAVVGWEAGTSYPSARNLKNLIDLCWERRAFHDGQEAEEIRALWSNSRVRVPLDETWLARLLARPSEPVISASIPHAPDVASREPGAGILVDWADAPEVSNFYGRESELALLGDWLLEQNARVVSVLGLGGIGKSTLAVTLMRRVASRFDAVIWRSLRDAPPFQLVLEDLLQLLSGGAVDVALDTFEQRINLLFEYLRARRVLLVLDNLESIMEAAEGSGHLLPGHEGYGRLMRRAAETRHKSCVLITSRERPFDLAPLEGSRTPVRSIHLGRLDAVASRSLLQDQEVTGSAADLERLIERYDGNPMALKIVAPTIADLFGGEIDAFLEQGEVIFGGVRQLLQDQFARLSELEEGIMFWLAILREATTVQELATVLVNPPPRAQLLEALDTLLGRSLIERSKVKGRFLLQSVVVEFATTRLIADAANEIGHGELRRLVTHRLELAGAKEYVQQSQLRLIVLPTLSRLRNAYAEPAVLQARLLALMETFRGRSEESQGYAPANLLSLLRALRGDLSGLDLRQLSIREADLRSVDLRDTNLAQATLRDTQFLEAFDAIQSIAIGSHGAFLAVGDRLGQVRVWAIQNRRLHLAWQAHHNNVSALAISPDEGHVATGGWEGVIKVWDVADGTLRWTSPAVGATMALAYSPDGRTLVSAGTDGHVRIWAAADGALLQTLSAHVGPIFCVAWRHDGEILAGAGHDARIRLWTLAGDSDAGPGPAPVRTLEGHVNLIWGLAFSPDSRVLASASWDGTVKFWDVERGTLGESIPVPARRSGLAWSRDGRYLASGGLERAFWIWDVQQRRQRTTSPGNAAPVHAAAFMPDGGTLVTATEDGSLDTWDMTTGHCIRHTQGYARTVKEVAWSPDSARIASGGNDALMTVWDISQPAPLHLLRGHKMIVTSVSWSPDGLQLASCSEDGTLRIWDAATGEGRRILTNGELAGAQLFATAWSPDGGRLAVASHRQGVLVYSVNTHTFERVGRSDAPPRTFRVEWSPDGKHLASSGEEAAILVWSAEDYSLCATLDGHRGLVAALAWTPDGTRLASGSWGRGSDQVLIWDTQSWNRLKVLEDPSESVFGVAWSADGTTLVSAGSDGMLRWWDARSGTCIMSRPGHQGPAQSLRASPDGRLLASCGDDGAIQIWRLESGEHVTTLRRDRPYERLDITGVKGLTDAQIQTLKLMGAIVLSPPDSQAKPEPLAV